jgi:CheY-like chemotaxis protein
MRAQVRPLVRRKIATEEPSLGVRMNTDPAIDLFILLVEDDRDLAEVTQAALQHEGLQVAVAYDGQEGLEMADRLHPQVIVTDLVMPVVDGLELIKRLGERPPPHSPVVAVSAVGSRLRAARELGAADVLLKPVDPADLLQSVRKAARTVH